MFRDFLPWSQPWVHISGDRRIRETHSRRKPQSFASPTSIATEIFENFVLTTSVSTEDPLNHTAVLNEKLSWHYYIKMQHSTTTYKMIFRLPTSVTNEQFDTYGIFKIIKACLNNITVNQVSRTIAYTKKSSLFTKQTDKHKSRSTTYDSSLRKKYSPKTAKAAKWLKKRFIGLS